MTRAKPELKNLVIVESPSKAKTIQKYLGKEFVVKASVGHIKDLPKSKLGVDVDHDFATLYQVLATKVKVVSELKAAARGAQNLYLATDPDREGEAIAWHIQEELSGEVKKSTHFHRVLFNVITKDSVQAAIKNPTELSLPKYHAQQARRILDRLVGYKISPLLWDKVKRGISAGRVQSVALRLIVDREREITAFKPQEYWTMEGDFEKDGQTLTCRLFKIKDQDPQLEEKAHVDSLLAATKDTEWKVDKIEKKERTRKPQPPFITSRLQQEAANRLGFSAKKTMTLAQKLYEGVNLGEFGTHGLITYLRTDSVRTDPAMLTQVRQYILTTFGANHLPPQPVIYQTKKSAQDAHEAIRPASLEFSPEKIRGFLEDDLALLYQLIWNRFVASQMAMAIMDQVALDIVGSAKPEAGDVFAVQFRATFSSVKFLGYLAVYSEKLEDSTTAIMKLPNWKPGDKVQVVKFVPEQHFTAPPARFNDASLIKDLEEKGIGRPSTYAQILSNLQDREYVEKRTNRFFPSELGCVVSDLLVQSFPEIVNPEFTAGLENQLDEIEEGKLNWLKSLGVFWKGFEKTLETAKVQMKNLKQQIVVTSIPCAVCHLPMVIKWGKMGSFLACSGYPECKNTQDFQKDDQGEIQIIPKQYSDKKCVKCNAAMLVKDGKFGKFLACSDYPACKSTQPFCIGINCPECKIGEIAQRQSTRFKRLFYGCVRYPDCNFASWDLPVQMHCPQCDYPLMVEKQTKRYGFVRKCLKKDCGFIHYLDQPERMQKADTKISEKKIKT
jgi:DNA topoisomerase-1